MYGARCTLRALPQLPACHAAIRSLVLRRLGWAAAARRWDVRGVPGHAMHARCTLGNSRVGREQSPCLRPVGHVVVCVVRHANAARQDRNDPCGRKRNTACCAMPCNPQAYTTRRAIQRRCAPRRRHARGSIQSARAARPGTVRGTSAPSGTTGYPMQHGHPTPARWRHGRGGSPERPQPSAIIHAM
jgi:hypothetical protein